jgi:hypothetical protein
MIVELTCPYCRFSKKLPKEKIPEGVKWVTCPRCRQRFEISEFYPETGPDADKIVEEKGYDGPGEGHGKDFQRHGSPWEDRSTLGLWQGIYQTLKAVLFSPGKLFRNLTCQGGIKEPLAFGLLVACLGAMIGFFWKFLILSGELLSLDYPFFGQFTAALIFLFVIVIIPVSVTLFMLLYSGILHILLRILRAGQNGFEATFSVVAYSQAAQVWALIPFFGVLVAGIWQLIVQIIGLREIHETSYLRVIIGLMIPVALIFLLVIMFAVFLFMYL